MSNVSMSNDVKSVDFDYKYVPVNEIVVEQVEDDKGKSRVKSVIIDDEAHEPSQRFFTSLFARFSFNKAFFKYFSHDEVFSRIAERDAGAERIRVCVERSTYDDGRQRSQLLAATNPARPIVQYGELMEKLADYSGEQISYSNGIVESHHRPRSSSNPLMIGGDEHANRFMMNCPVDGYGMPSIYLALIRQVCSNGMIALSKAFRSSITLGSGEDENVSFALTRALDGFNNDEGFAALRQRTEQAALSWCSVNEANSLYKLLVGLHSKGQIRKIGGDGASTPATPAIRQSLKNYQSSYKPLEDENPIGGQLMTAYHGMTGDTTRLYGLANLDSLSIKRQRTLPVDCTVYDAINFATEVATHHSDPEGARRLNGWVGTLVTGEYDMEGTKSQYEDFADFHLGAKVESGMTGSEFSAN